MNNLSQSKSAAKQAYLDKQQNAMLALFQKADQNERAAIIKQIDSFLPVVSGDEKSFWLKFRQKLERLGERSNGVKPGKCSMECGDDADYDGKYCRTCVGRMIEDDMSEDEAGDDFSDSAPCEDVPF